MKNVHSRRGSSYRRTRPCWGSLHCSPGPWLDLRGLLLRGRAGGATKRKGEGRGRGEKEEEGQEVRLYHSKFLDPPMVHSSV